MQLINYLHPLCNIENELFFSMYFDHLITYLLVSILRLHRSGLQDLREAGGRMPGCCLPLQAAQAESKDQFHKQATDHHGSGASNLCSRKHIVLKRKK